MENKHLKAEEKDRRCQTKPYNTIYTRNGKADLITDQCSVNILYRFFLQIHMKQLFDSIFSSY